MVAGDCVGAPVGAVGTSVGANVKHPSIISSTVYTSALVDDVRWSAAKKSSV